MKQIKSVVVIFNPNSTGDGEKNAREFVAKAKKAGLAAVAVPTKRAGHARTLAREYAERPTPTIIISSSGDGGYNEVVNGVLNSKNPATVVGVLPSGNANDHWNFMHHGDVIKRIKSNDIRALDVLKLSCDDTHRYAHSYIGLGVTSQIGEVLTKNDLNPLKESWLVLTHLFKIRPVKIRLDGRTRRYDHLIFSNIARMSKYLKVTDRGTTHDGIFEVIAVRSGGFLGLLKHFLLAAAKGHQADDIRSQVEFTCLKPLTVQLDGEVENYKRGDVITIESVKKALNTII